MAFETRSDRIIWSRGYSIPEFLSAYGKKLPQIVKVVQGFHGDYLVDSVGIHEILRVHKHSCQKRVIGQDTFGQPLSIPVNFEMPLELVVDGKSASPPTSLKSILDKVKLPFKVRIPNVTPVSADNKDLGIFRLDSQFEQRHLLVNFVLVDELETRVRMMPSSIEEIRLAVGKGFDKPGLNWKGFLAELDEVASSLDYNGISGSSDIALYAAGTVNNETMPYENLIPNKYLSVKGNSVEPKSIVSLGSPIVKGPIKDLIHAIKKHVPRGNMYTRDVQTTAPRQKGGSSHYENVEFQLERRRDSFGTATRKRSSSESQVTPYAKPDSAFPPLSGGNPSERPEPLRRTVRDKPRNDRIKQELPPDPYVYRAPRQTIKETTAAPISNAPLTAPKPALKPSSTSESPGNHAPLWNAPPIAPKPARKPPLTSESLLNQLTTSTAPYSAEETVKPHLSVKPLQKDDPQGPLSSDNRISTMQQVPNDLSSLTADQIAICLQLLNLDEDAIGVFREKQLDGCFLKLISEENLRKFLENETRLSLIDRERTINFIKHKWRPS